MASKTPKTTPISASNRKITRQHMSLSDDPEPTKPISIHSPLFNPVEVAIKDKRDRIAEEILKTEQTYVRSLSILHQVFKVPMQQELNITDDQIQTLFSNLEDLIRINTELLTCLLKRLSNWSETQLIGDVLWQMTPFLRLYTTYTLNFEKAREVLHDLSKKPAFASFLENRQSDPNCSNLDFSSYLIMPIQRIPRYRLLLEDFLQNTSENHADYKMLSEALEKLKIVASDVNKAVTEQENRDKMVKVCKKFIDYKENELIQPGRTFVHEGELSKVCRKDRQKRRFFLFSDVLIYAYSNPPNKFRVGRKFDLFKLKLKDIPDSSQRKLRNAFQIQSEQKSFIVLADNQEEKKFWLDKLYETQQAFKERLLTFKKDPGQPEDQATTAPVWVPDNEVKACTICETKFTFTNRRHHCRQCGAVVCGVDSNQKKELPGQGKVRVCTNCYNSRTLETKEGHKMVQNHMTVEDSSDSFTEAEVIYELKALFDFTPKGPSAGTMLKFKQGDIINVLQVDDSGWWLGELYGEKGWVPYRFLETPLEN